MLTKIWCGVVGHDWDLDLLWAPERLPEWAADIQPSPKPDKHLFLHICRRCKSWKWDRHPLELASERLAETREKVIEALQARTEKWKDTLEKAEQQRAELDEKTKRGLRQASRSDSDPEEPAEPGS